MSDILGAATLFLPLCPLLAFAVAWSNARWAYPAAVAGCGFGCLASCVLLIETVVAGGAAQATLVLYEWMAPIGRFPLDVLVPLSTSTVAPAAGLPLTRTVPLAVCSSQTAACKLAVVMPPMPPTV